MPSADDIRDHCQERYIDQARGRGESHVKIRMGDVHEDLRLKNRIPQVVSALGTDRFERQCRLRRTGIEGPLNSTSTVFVFELLPLL